MNSALIIGGGRGIGRALTEGLLSRTDTRNVVASCRSQSSLESLQAIDDERLQGVHLDVTDDASIDAMASRLGEDLPVPNLVIHAAGILHEDDIEPEKSLRQCRRDAMRRLFEVNSIGPLLVAQAVIPRMARKARGHYAMLSAMVGSIEDNR
ncbi:MAG: SDR family NAD(P)-dependent oxidoreductase, partial [Xanthomonadales bacterium]|nr:SDR family NAD(P)-dependent oxidoreductase [Xanthomonadales bacterium]